MSFWRRKSSQVLGPGKATHHLSKWTVFISGVTLWRSESNLRLPSSHLPGKHIRLSGMHFGIWTRPVAPYLFILPQCPYIVYLFTLHVFLKDASKSLHNKLECKWINWRTKDRDCQTVILKETTTDVFHLGLILGYQNSISSKTHQNPNDSHVVWHFELDWLGFDFWLYHFLAMWSWMSQSLNLAFSFFVHDVGIVVSTS